MIWGAWLKIDGDRDPLRQASDDDDASGSTDPAGCAEVLKTQGDVEGAQDERDDEHETADDTLHAQHHGPRDVASAERNAAMTQAEALVLEACAFRSRATTVHTIVTERGPKLGFCPWAIAGRLADILLALRAECSKPSVFLACSYEQTCMRVLSELGVSLLPEARSGHASPRTRGQRTNRKRRAHPR